MASNVRAMNPVPIATKAPVQHYPAYSLPTHTTTESLRAAYAAQVDATPRSVSVIGTATNRKYNSDYMCSTAAVAAATHAAAITNTTTTNDHPYTFLVQSNSVKTLKSLCTTSANLPTLLKASLEANLQGMAASGDSLPVLSSLDSLNECDIESRKSNALDGAQNYFQQSGILGQLRKSSKAFIAAKSDAINVDRIRKNSKVIMKQMTERRKSDYDDLNESETITDLQIKYNRMKQMETENNQLKNMLLSRDDQINDLKREIDKLKSVLSITTNHRHAMYRHGSDGDILSCLQGQCDKSTAPQPSLAAVISDKTDDIRRAVLHGNGVYPRHVKKQAVSGETSQLLNHIAIQKYDKDFRSKQLIKDAIMDNDFLKNIDSSQTRELVEAMYSRDVAKDEYVILEDDVGSHLFVSAEGEFEVVKDGKVLGMMGVGKAFGELAILYNCKRTASIKALCNARVWVLDRQIYQQIMMRTGIQKIEENVRFLRSVPLMQTLSWDLLAKVADVLEVEFYPAGVYILRQGTRGDTFYLISQGEVKVTQTLPGHEVDDTIRVLSRGDYFGEQALLKEDKRTANIIAMQPGVECLTLDRESFIRLIGDLSELHERDYGDESRMALRNSTTSTANVFEKVDVKEEYLDIEFDDLSLITTIGIGGFGRVELVKYTKDESVRTFALKCLKKQNIVDTRQEQHVLSERNIMLACDCTFIAKLYRTYHDQKYVYMLLEACLGGEVWTILRDRGYFDDFTAQFIIGCVLEAFEYLHKRGIVYRDLKPENLMLDDRGYIKLVDFGFAKYIGYSTKTWTFCGTPEYVAPEIILNKGHDRAVDYWALGILIRELLTGSPPFTNSDPMRTYTLILKGIDKVDFPSHMSRSAVLLIKKLCRDVPTERLGYQRGGIDDIKKHKWFQSFDWDGLSEQTLMPPLIQMVSSPVDTRNFDYFPFDDDIPPDELSGWDEEF